jgi:hypothetical protein
MESPVVTVLNIGETLIPCTWILRIVHVEDVHTHLIDYLCLSISLGVESNWFFELGVQKRPETRPKCDKEPVVLVRDDGMWYPKVDPHSF